MLHNFGGNNGMMGMIDVVATQPALAQRASGATLIGLGTTPEGIFQNELMYDLLYDMGWRSSPIPDVHAWVRAWVMRRYGLPVGEVGRFAAVFAGWDGLVRSVYNCTTGQWGVTKSFVELTPSLQMNSTGFMPTALWYDNRALQRSFALLLNASQQVLASVDAVGVQRFEYDLIDVGKQWLSNLLITYHAQLVHAYRARNLTELSGVGARILQLISDWDSLLATSERFLLGRWIEDARRWGLSIEEEEWLEWNARNQVTLWGPTGQIADYASKQWSGLLSAYYAPRWQLFVASLEEAVRRNATWDEAAYQTAKRVGEQAWQMGREKYPTTPQGSTVQWARYVYSKYS